MQQRERERRLELDDDGRLVAADRDDVGGADLGLDLVTLRLEQRLDRPVEISLFEDVAYTQPKPRAMVPSMTAASAM